MEEELPPASAATLRQTSGHGGEAEPAERSAPWLAELGRLPGGDPPAPAST